MKAVITGATGLLGGNLALQLLAEDSGIEVVCTRRRTSRIEHLGDAAIQWVEADLDQPEALAQAFDGADVVFHCAAMVSTLRKPTPRITQVNVTGTDNVLDAVVRAGVGRLVHCSSVVARALSSDGLPVTEDQPWNFDQRGMADGYSVTKYQSQQRVEAAARERVDAVIVNPCYMFGPHDAKPSSGGLIIDVLQRKVPGYTEGYNNFVDVRDVARGMIAAWRRGRRGESYILGHRNMSYRQIMDLIAEIGGVRAPARPVPKPLGLALGWIGEGYRALTGREDFFDITRIRFAYCRDFIFSSAKATAELDYQPGPLEPAIRDAIDWFRAQGML